MKYILLFLLLLIPTVNALNCNNVNDRESCLEILNDNELTNEEKEMLISALIYQSYYPDHDFIYNWNRNVDLDYNGENNGYIYDAWVKIKGISPSVILNDELYCSDEGKILTDYDYYISIPNYRFNHDCRTNWIKEAEIPSLSVYANGNYIDNERVSEFNINSDTRFTARFNVYLRTRIEHYREEEYCCRRRNGRCIRWCERCEFHNSERIENQVNVYDYLNVKHYDKEPNLNFEVIDNDFNGLSFKADVSDNSYLNIEFEDSYYNSFNYFYGLVIDHDNLITLKAFPSNISDFRNIIISDGVFHVRNSEDCRIKYGDHFNSYEYDCNLNYEEYDLRIETDKLSYNIGDSVIVSIYPDDRDVMLSYGGEEVIVRGTYEFEALPYYNKIKTKLDNEESYKIIHVKDEKNLKTLFSFGVFSGIGYLFYLICRKYYRGFL